MSVTDPDCPFHLAYRLGITIVGATARLPRTVLYDPGLDVAIISPDYEWDDYCRAADWLLSVASSARRPAASA